MAAVIAAVVSVVVVAAGSVGVTYLTTRASLRRDHDRQQAEFRPTMTARLCDRRVATYPELFAATDAFRNSRLDAAQDTRHHLEQAMAQVDKWHAAGGGLVLSILQLPDVAEGERAQERPERGRRADPVGQLAHGAVAQHVQGGLHGWAVQPPSEPVMWNST